jgi:hypothetical protein
LDPWTKLQIEELARASADGKNSDQEIIQKLG